MRAVSEKEITIARSSPSMASTTFLAASLALASRLGATSVADMLPELSIIRTNRWPVVPVPLTCGPERL